ncbi:MAG: glutamate racemase [Chitinophagales bacterium]|nr:glutamate racemase [Chitinophagales bacterium]HQU38583.1 glutamate racemase [Chitinophagales bacterium]
MDLGATPIGIFDSGYGGLTVMRSIVDRLPQYDYVYFGDNARTPYGNRSFETVYEFTRESVFHLFDMGCELVILACNTASAKALRTIQQQDLPRMASGKRVLGVIRPTTELIGQLTHSGQVGVLATNGTVNSASYVIEAGRFFPHVEVHQQACPMWVPLVENNELDGAGTEYFVQRSVEQLMEQDPRIDAIILGCTHYPLLEPVIRRFLPPYIHLLSQGPVVAERLDDYLERHPDMAGRCSKTGKRTFFTTDDPASFNRHATIFFGESVASHHFSL